MSTITRSGCFIRLLKAMLVVSCASLLVLGFTGNIFAYDVNFEYIKNIMSMNDVPKHPFLSWRAVYNPFYYHVFYISIIVIEGIASLLLLTGIYHIIKNLKSEPREFLQSIQWSQIGLLLSLVLYSLLFFMVGGEWFSSWQSSHWNAKSASMPFIMLLGITFLIISQKE